MKISVNSRTVFCFPTGLAFNRFSAGVVCRKLQKEGIRLTKKQTLAFIKEIKKYKKRHPDWILVEVFENGEHKVTVKI